MLKILLKNQELTYFNTKTSNKALLFSSLSLFIYIIPFVESFCLRNIQKYKIHFFLLKSNIIPILPSEN